MKLEKLYYRLKSLIADNVELHVRDHADKYGGKACVEVSLISSTNSYHWTTFRAETVEDALRKAIDKLRHPDKNYVDENGKVWKAKESSIYSAEHTRTFLRKTQQGLD